MHEDLTDAGAKQNGANIMNTLTRKLREAKPGEELKIFAEDELTAALSAYVDKAENGAFETFYTKAMKETQHKLLTTTMRGGGGGAVSDSVVIHLLRFMTSHPRPLFCL